MVDLIQLFDDAGMFLDRRTYGQATKLARQFFSSYSWLNEWAEEADRYLFHVTMKFHTCGHMTKSSCDINPRCCWNFRSEDFVGRMSTLGSSVVHGVKSTRLCSKINDKYQVLLHLQLVRLGFDNVHWEPSMEIPWPKGIPLLILLTKSFLGKRVSSLPTRHTLTKGSWHIPLTKRNLRAGTPLAKGPLDKRILG
jgi:hypothetical protein